MVHRYKYPIKIYRNIQMPQRLEAGRSEITGVLRKGQEQSQARRTGGCTCKDFS